MNGIYLLLGSNEGDRLGRLNQAIKAINERCGIIKKQSAIYETAAWGKHDQADFLNMVVLLKTSLQPLQLLQTIISIEKELGRKRIMAWGPRIIDIDILFYNNEIIDMPELKVPHPYLHERRFTLVPLQEIAPDFVHPVLHKTCTELLTLCTDPLQVALFKPEQ